MNSGGRILKEIYFQTIESILKPCGLHIGTESHCYDFQTIESILKQKPI